MNDDWAAMGDAGEITTAQSATMNSMDQQPAMTMMA